MIMREQTRVFWWLSSATKMPPNNFPWCIRNKGRRPRSKRVKPMNFTWSSTMSERWIHVFVNWSMTTCNPALDHQDQYRTGRQRSPCQMASAVGGNSERIANLQVGNIHSTPVEWSVLLVSSLRKFSISQQPSLIYHRRHRRRVTTRKRFPDVSKLLSRENTDAWAA